MNKIVYRPDESLELGFKLSHATYAINQAELAEPGSGEKAKAILVMQKSLGDLKGFANKQENIFDRFIRRLLNLMGIVTNYQRIINQIKHLESRAGELSEEEIPHFVEHLEELRKQKPKVQLKIGKEILILSRQFKEIEAAIADLDRSAKQLTRMGDSFTEVQQLLALHQKHLREMKNTLDDLAKIYQGDISLFAEIPYLWERHAVAEKVLKEISTHLAHLIQPRKLEPDKSEAVPVNPPGGIHNGGNTCYLASAMQAINRLPVYRELFDSQKHPLVKKSGETDASYKERCLIQKRGFSLLEKIKSGQNASTKEINTFRTACYNHQQSSGKRVVKNTHGPLDSIEVLGRILAVLDYKAPQMVFTYQDVIVDSDDYVPCSPFNSSGKPINPNGYRTIEEAKNYSKEGTFTLSAYPYLNGTVSMDNLLKDFWKEEELAEYFVKHVDKVTGDVSFRKYKNVKRKVSLDLTKSEMPKVLHVTIQQLDGNRATVTQPNEIYPSGTRGVGPRYKLAASIEHMPGHYVAHIIMPNGCMQANDGWVHKETNSNFPGYGYFYVLDEA